MSLELFSNQEICHIYLNGEKRICTVSTYIKEFLSIVEIENKKCQRCSKLKPPVLVVYEMHRGKAEISATATYRANEGGRNLCDPTEGRAKTTQEGPA